MPNCSRRAMLPPGDGAMACRGRRPGGLVEAGDVGSAFPREAAASLEALPGGGYQAGKGAAGAGVLLQDPAQQEEGLPVALLQGGSVVPAPAAPPLAVGEAGGAGPEQRLHGGAELGAAQLVAGAVRLAALDAVLPALGGAVDDRGGLAGLHVQGPALGGEHQAQVEPVRHLDHVPVVEVEELPRVPLHVVPGPVPVAGHPVGVDGGLVPVEVDDGVAQAGGAGESGRLGYPARGEAALALDEVDAGGVGPEVVGSGQRQAQRAAEAHPGGAGGQLDEGSGRSGMAVEGLRPEATEQGGGLRRVAAEAEQVLEAQPEAFFSGQGARVPDAHHLVAEGQHGVEAQGLVAGGIGEQVGVAAVGVADVVVQGAEQGGGHEAPRRHRATRVARLGIVEQHRAEGAVDEVEPRQMGDETVPGQVGVGAGHLDPNGSPRSERSAHLSSVVVAWRPAGAGWPVRRPAAPRSG